MARTQAKVLGSIWIDDDWCGLTAGAQRLYLLLLSQPRLNIAGCIDLMPERWARLAADTDRAGIAAALAELTERTYLVVDEDEVILRTFTRHDLAVGALNVNLVKGFWSAWSGIRSAVLRKVIIDNLPDVIWSKSGDECPDQAKELRSEPQLELPLRPQSEPSVDLLPDPCSLLTAPSTSPQTTHGGGSDGDPEGGGEDREQQVRRTASLIGRAVAASKGQDDAYAAGVRKRILTDADRTDRDRIRTALDEGQTPEQITADWITPSALPAPTRPTLVRPLCSDCEGSGWLIPLDSDTATRCKCNPDPREATA